LFVLLLAPAGERNEYGVTAPGFQAHAARDLMSAHARHSNVDDRGARTVARSDFQRLDAIERNGHLVSRKS
jgi:hypothetical protein